jgi:hypothetical protein
MVSPECSTGSDFFTLGFQPPVPSWLGKISCFFTKLGKYDIQHWIALYVALRRVFTETYATGWQWVDRISMVNKRCQLELAAIFSKTAIGKCINIKLNWENMHSFWENSGQFCLGKHPTFGLKLQQKNHCLSNNFLFCIPTFYFICYS